MSAFERRAATTASTLARLSSTLGKYLGEDAARILRDDTCIYVVGSGGRGEMTAHSDVDLFVSRVGRPSSDVDALLVRQAMARALFELGLPDPSQGRAFLVMHTAASLREQLGTPADDVGNTFTARMLLLLESRALLGDQAYDALLNDVLTSYWTDAVGHEAVYQPFVIVNDVVRYWRNLLLNYVAKNVEKEKELAQPKRGAERRLRSYKLRCTRCLTCFSFLASLLAVTSGRGVAKDDVIAIAKKRPIDRLLDLKNAPSNGQAAHEHASKLLDLYGSYLEITDRPKPELVEAFLDKDFALARAREGREFGDAMFDLLSALGSSRRGRELFRYMVV